MIDILVVVERVEEKQNITLKTGEQKAKQSLFVFDDTGEIMVTFWGDKVEELTSLSPDNILIIKNCIVKEYQGRSLSATASTSLSKDIPEIQRYKELLLWMQRDGNKKDLKKLSVRGDRAQY